MRKARSCTHICRTGGFGGEMGEETKLKGCNTDEVEPSSLEEKKKRI